MAGNISTKGTSLFCNIDIPVRVQSFYTKGAKLRWRFSLSECHFSVSDIAPPLVSLSRILSVVLHQPPSSSARPLPPPPLEISPGLVWTNQSRPWPRPANHRLGLVTECGHQHQLLLCSIPAPGWLALMSQFESRLQSSGSGVHISPCQSRSQCWNEWS